MTPMPAVRWFEIYVNDMPRAVRFYEAVFQISLKPLPPPKPDLVIYAFDVDQTAPGANGALIKHPIMKPGGCGTLVYFGCADCAIEQLRCVEHGGIVHVAKHSIAPYGHMAVVEDSEGNHIGLHSMT